MNKIFYAQIMQGFRARGFAGKLYVSLVGVRGFDGQSSGASLTYTLTPLDYGESLPADEVAELASFLSVLSNQPLMSTVDIFR
jgi:hypothetical protein